MAASGSTQCRQRVGSCRSPRTTRGQVPPYREELERSFGGSINSKNRFIESATLGSFGIALSCNCEGASDDRCRKGKIQNPPRILPATLVPNFPGQRKRAVFRPPLNLCSRFELQRVAHRQLRAPETSRSGSDGAPAAISVLRPADAHRYWRCACHYKSGGSPCSADAPPGCALQASTCHHSQRDRGAPLC